MASGYGVFLLVFPFVSLTICTLIGNAIDSTDRRLIGVACAFSSLLSAAFSVWLGLRGKLNRTVVEVETRTGREFRRRTRNSLLWIEGQWWAIPHACLAIWFLYLGFR